MLIALGAALVLLVAVTARLVRDRRDHTRVLRELTTERERERELGAEAALAGERARIALELHEVVARTLGAIATNARAAETLLDAEPERAHRPLQAIRRAADEALGELRRLLGDADGDGEEPPPGLAQLPALVERARAAGMPVTLHVEGQPRHAPAGLELSAFRIVQEALANAHKHARGAPATVHVVWERRTLSLQIRDVGASRRGPAVNEDGHGLVGIRERVRALGGELQTGRLPGGGFEVTAVLPFDVRRIGAPGSPPGQGRLR